MAAKPGAASTTDSPINHANKTRPPIFTCSDIDWLRPDSRAFSFSGQVLRILQQDLLMQNLEIPRFGPRESKKAMMYSDIGRLNSNVSYTAFATPVREQGSDHKEFSSMLHKALEGVIKLETFPKTTVDVFALVLESGGSDLPVVISCASLALADAGIMIHA
ncbi:exosome complex component RRP41-like isoform X2 [Mangifera indica]|uniref:exosome complex component RRP41-like isoform X2 n=1 Tax=Mangifera indica TaxID=29780 RepID=UPI001CFB735F|nr:exosome complex component RRP41-like isoform X2 [Mangifera indica]